MCVDGHFVNACVRFFNGQTKRRRRRKQKAYMCTKFAIIAIRWCTPNACKYSLTHSNDLYYFCLVSAFFCPPLLNSGFHIFMRKHRVYDNNSWAKTKPTSFQSLDSSFLPMHIVIFWKKKFGIHNLSLSLHFKSSSFLCCFVGFLALFRLTLAKYFRLNVCATVERMDVVVAVSFVGFWML